MSAYVVDRAHIAFLVEAAAQISRLNRGPFRWYWNHDHGRGTMEYEEITYMDHDKAAELGGKLWAENVKSVAYRYPDDAPGDLPGPIDAYPYFYGPHKSPADFWGNPQTTAVRVLKACDGYEYQTCEHPGWETSEMHAFLDRLRRSWVGRIPGYDDAQWEVTAERVA